MSFRDQDLTSKRTNQLFLVVFFSYGFVKMTCFDIVLAGVEDILGNTNYSSGWISATMNIPFLLIVFFLRTFQEQIKDVHKFWSAFVTMVLGSFGVGFLPTASLRIAASCLTGVGASCIETTVLYMSAKYSDTIVHTYIVGDAFGRILSPCIYTVLTTYLCLKPQLVFTTISMSSVIFPLYYHLILNKFTNYQPRRRQHEELFKRRFSRDEVYLSDEQNSESETFLGDETMYEKSTKTDKHKSIPFPTKLVLLYKAFPRLYVDFLGFFFQTLLLQSFFTTLVFSNAPFKQRDHYQYYLLALWSGLFSGRLYGYFSKCCGDISESFSLSTNTKSWIITFLTLCNFTLILSAVWYRNMPNVWVVLLLAFITGVMAGIGYVLALFPVSEKESHIAFTRTITVVTHGVGCVSGALVAIVLEPVIRERCFEVTQTTEYCIARYIGIGSKPCYSTG